MKGLRNKLIILALGFILIIVMGIFLEPKNSDYLVNKRGITCWKCSHEITGEVCDNCNSSISEVGLLTNRAYICNGCNKQLFWTYTSKCYYCNEVQNLDYEKFSSKFDSYSDYQNQLNDMVKFSLVYMVSMILYIIVCVIFIISVKVRKRRCNKC